MTLKLIATVTDMSQIFRQKDYLQYIRPLKGKKKK